MNLKLERNANQDLTTVEKRRVYFPRSEFHTRYAAFFGMEDSRRWSTYHRSIYKDLEGVPSKKVTFMGNQTNLLGGMYPKTGNFYSPFHFKPYQAALQLQKKTPSPLTAGLWYDALLEWQKAAAMKVVDAIRAKETHFLINADHQYPCVLVSLPKPSLEKNDSVWSNFLSLFLIAIANQLATERGINIELVRRSSFDALRPSVAECGKSLRISLGLSPGVYVDCMIDALTYLDKLFKSTDIFEVPVDPKGSVAKVLAKYNEAKSTEKKKINLQLKETLWESLWLNGDSKNHSFATQIFRREQVVEYLIDQFMLGLASRSVESLFASKEHLKLCFANPLVNFFSSLCCSKAKSKTRSAELSTTYAQKALSTFVWCSSPEFEDEAFWTFVEKFALAIEANEAEVKALSAKKQFKEFYQHLECWLAHFSFSPIDDEETENGYGSDSDTEADVPVKEESKTIFSKKFITATGMRAIQLAHVVAKRYLEETTQIDPSYIQLSTQNMYYETDEALNRFPIPLESKEGSREKGPQMELGFFDINHCNSLQVRDEKPIVELGTKDKICILDMTSATMKELAEYLNEIWDEFPQLKVILTVSSGLKNEQGMADYNPYGTIRIFSTDKTDRDKIYQDLIDFEDAAHYQHPKSSHLMRKMAKDHGLTPTNEAILKCCAKR